jgi:hypothetical protein
MMPGVLFPASRSSRVLRVLAAPSLMSWRPSAVSFFVVSPSFCIASRDTRLMIPASVRAFSLLSSIIFTAAMRSRAELLAASRAISVRISIASELDHPCS